MIFAGLAIGLRQREYEKSQTPVPFELLAQKIQAVISEMHSPSQCR